jgi:hypothetical protein
MSVLVVGSIAIDTVKTPVEEHSELLGGSAAYAALAASFFSPVRLVGVVGDDFPNSEFDFWQARKIDTQGVQRANGKTFRWSGEYSWDLNTRETRSIDLNVFKDFKPVLPKISPHRFRLARQYRALAANACARANGASAFRCSRHNGSMDRDSQARSGCAASAR